MHSKRALAACALLIGASVLAGGSATAGCVSAEVTPPLVTVAPVNECVGHGDGRPEVCTGSDPNDELWLICVDAV